MSFCFFSLFTTTSQSGSALPFDHSLHELLHQLVIILPALPLLFQADVQRVVAYRLKQTGTVVRSIQSETDRYSGSFRKELNRQVQWVVPYSLKQTGTEGRSAQSETDRYSGSFRTV